MAFLFHRKFEGISYEIKVLRAVYARRNREILPLCGTRSVQPYQDSGQGDENGIVHGA